MIRFTKPTLLIGLLVLFIMSVTYSQKIHEEMNQREREQVFLSPNVPDYEIVSIYWPRIQKRDVQNKSSIQLKVFGEHIKLWLNPTDGILAGGKTPLYVVWNRYNGSEITKAPENTMTRIMTYLFEDLSKAATLAVNSNSNGRKKIIGIIGMKNLGIRPVPKRFVKKVEKYRRSLDGIQKSEYNDHHYHIVYKIASTQLMKPFRNIVKKQRLKRSIPSVIYPEILVVVGFDLYQLFHKSALEILPYLLAFWNAVDMQYRNIENPKIRLNIAGILLPQHSDALEYMAENMHSDRKLLVHNSLHSFGKWLFKQDRYIPVNNYDAAITMTSCKLCSLRSDIYCNKHVIGLAFTSTACDVNVYSKDMSKTGIVHDKAGFDGIVTAAHELGHILGAKHDGTDHQDCAGHYGQIMSSWNIVTNKSADWSNCSLSDFQSFLELKNSNPTCLFNIPNQVGKAIPRYLPGKIMDANAQCQKIIGTHAMIGETICQNLVCASSNNSVIMTGGPAADGTSCGNGKLCLHQQCISENEIN